MAVAESIATKKCSRCKAEKLTAAFNRNAGTRDGRHPWCSECTRLAAKTYNATDRARALSLERNRRWRATPRGHASHVASVRENRHKNPVSASARLRVWRALAKGVLLRPADCSACKLVGPVHAHHEDYARPLDVVWLCPRCHKKEDSRGK